MWTVSAGVPAVGAAVPPDRAVAAGAPPPLPHPLPVRRPGHTHHRLHRLAGRPALHCAARPRPAPAGAAVVAARQPAPPSHRVHLAAV